jgi:RNA polymerase sigma-70 factor (ECF subfamily)
MQKEKELSLQRIGLNFFESREEKDFTRVYYRMKPGISMYLREMLPGMDDREEVIATTFAKVWGKIHQYDPYWNFSTWVYRIARNEALLFFRGKKRTYSYDAMKEMGINVDIRAGVETPEYAEDEYVGTTERLHDIVLEEIENLPQMYRDVLTLREVEKMKYEDIAQQLDWKVNTVRTRIHKARRIIRSEITKRDPDLLKQYQDAL